MTPAEIIAAAREASNTGSADELTGDAIQRFAAIIAAKQREKDAQIVTDMCQSARDFAELSAFLQCDKAIRGQE